MLSEDDLRRRKPLWTAISTLWLDTEKDRADLEHIASVAIRSGYSVKELDEIYRYEVAPVVYQNLHSVAGVWAGFDEAWLHQEAGKRAKSRSFWVRWWIGSRVGRWYITNTTQAEWHEVLALVRVASARSQI